MARLPAASKAIALVLALVLAGVATWVVYAYVRGVEERALADAEPVEVFVAQETLPAGASAAELVDAGLIAPGVTPQASVPAGAIGSLEEIAGLVTAERIIAGEVIVAERWVAPGEAVVDFTIPEGFEAISVEVGLVPGVAGFIDPGDRISMIATLVAPEPEPEDDEAGTEEEAEAAGVEPSTRSEYLLQNVEVLAVGPRAVAAEGEEPTAGSVLLTIALEAENAERLVFAIQNASLYFTLLPEDAEPVETPGRTLESLFD